MTTDKPDMPEGLREMLRKWNHPLVEAVEDYFAPAKDPLYEAQDVREEIQSALWDRMDNYGSDIHLIVSAACEGYAHPLVVTTHGGQRWLIGIEPLR